MVPTGVAPDRVRVNRWTLEPVLVPLPLAGAAFVALIAGLTIAAFLGIGPRLDPWVAVATIGLLLFIAGTLIADLLRMRRRP